MAATLLFYGTGLGPEWAPPGPAWAWLGYHGPSTFPSSKCYEFVFGGEWAGGEGGSPGERGSSKFRPEVQGSTTGRWGSPKHVLVVTLLFVHMFLDPCHHGRRCFSFRFTNNHPRGRRNFSFRSSSSLATATYRATVDTPDRSYAPDRGFMHIALYDP